MAVPAQAPKYHPWYPEEWGYRRPLVRAAGTVQRSTAVRRGPALCGHSSAVQGASSRQAPGLHLCFETPAQPHHYSGRPGGAPGWDLLVETVGQDLGFPVCVRTTGCGLMPAEVVREMGRPLRHFRPGQQTRYRELCCLRESLVDPGVA